MGDGADLALEYMSDIDELYLKYSNSSPAEMYEAGLVDELGYDPRYIRPAKTCRCCGAGNLHWGTFNNKWRLYTSDNILHNCPVNPLNENQNA